MRSVIFIAVVVNLIYLQLSTTSNVFPSSKNGWFGRSSQDNDYDLIEENNAASLKYSNCLKLRGGASSDDKTDSKIKGVCVGIDLGTTYRCSKLMKCCSTIIVTHTIVSCTSLTPVVVLLSGRMDEWKYVLTSKGIG